jgi:DNA-binding MarR family transcriptional regulator
MDKVAVNRAARVLEERGLVARVPNPDDGRSHLLALTGEGRAIHAEVMPLARATERELLDGLAPDEEAQLRALLAKLRARATALAAQMRKGPERA